MRIEKVLDGCEIYTPIGVDADELIDAIKKAFSLVAELYECGLYETWQDDFQVVENDTSPLGDAKGLLNKWGHQNDKN